MYKIKKKSNYLLANSINDHFRDLAVVLYTMISVHLLMAFIKLFDIKFYLFNVKLI